MFILPLEEQASLTTLLSQSHRYYHNINHINDCLTELEYSTMMLSFEEIREITYAIWYHDAIYNPYSKLNEECSVQLLQKSSYLPTTIIENISSIILSTSKHLNTQENLSLTTQVMLDIDLSGFGKEWPVYCRNTLNVRKEYYNTDNTTFVINRINFLETINLRNTLYYTDYFKNTYDENSKTNIDNELSLLKSEYILDYLNTLSGVAYGCSWDKIKLL